jgi:hypothetical protein
MIVDRKAAAVHVTFACDADDCEEQLVSDQYPSVAWAERMLAESGWSKRGGKHFCQEHTEAPDAA